MNKLDALINARELIAKPKGWTQQTHARDANGASVYVHSDEACSFCARGAILHVVGKVHYPAAPVLRVLEAVARQNFDSDVVDINDNKGKRAVMNLFNQAITLQLIINESHVRL